MFTSLRRSVSSRLRGELDAGDGHRIPSVHDVVVSTSQRLHRLTADSSPPPPGTDDCSRPGCSDSARLARGSPWRGRGPGTRWRSTARSRGYADATCEVRGNETSSGRRFDHSSRRRDSWSAFSRSYLGVSGRGGGLFGDQVIHHFQRNVRTHELVEAARHLGTESVSHPEHSAYSSL